MRTTSSWWLLSMAEVFRRKQLPLKQLFQDSGLSIKSLAHSDTRFPQDGVTRLWESAASLDGSDHIGLDVGRQVKISGFPVLGYSLITATGLAECFQRFSRYQRMIGESSNIQLILKDQQPLISFHFSGDSLPVSSHSIDASMAALISLSRVMEGDSWSPKRVSLRRKKPKSLQHFKEYYRCPITFEADHDAVYLDSNSFSDNLLTSGTTNDYELFASLKEEKPIAELVEMIIKPKLQDGIVSKAWVCECLSITQRTLHRRLSKEGENYKRIIDRVREELALEYLLNPKISQNEVAFLCGFSDLSAFHHAFKRWRGETPRKYIEGTHNKN